MDTPGRATMGLRSRDRCSGTREQIEISSGSEEEHAPDGQSRRGDESAPLCTVDGVPLYDHHRDTLLEPGAWLTDELINAYGHILATDAVHCCTSFFYPSVARRAASPAELRTYMARWRAPVPRGVRVFLVPVNWANAHWALAEVDAETRSVVYYDSLMSRRHGRTATRVVARAFSSLCTVGDDEAQGMSALVERLSLSSGDAGKTAPPAIYEERIPAGQQQQTDGSSCGVFVCWRMAQLAGAHVDSQCDPASYRQRISASLFGSG